MLRELRGRFGSDGPRMVQLVDDIPAGDLMVTPVGLREISTYAQAIGPSRDRLLFADGELVADTSAWSTMPTGPHSRLLLDPARRERLPPQHLRRGEAPEAHGDALGEARLLLDLGVDGLITDAPDHAARAVRSSSV